MEGSQRKINVIFEIYDIENTKQKWFEHCGWSLKVFWAEGIKQARGGGNWLMEGSQRKTNVIFEIYDIENIRQKCCKNVLSTVDKFLKVFRNGALDR